MLSETKLALRITATVYDSELANLIHAGARDLQLAGIDLNGEVGFSYAQDQSGHVTVTDECSMNDPLIMRAIITYVRAHFGSPNDYDRLVESYDTQKAQLMSATGYTDWGEDQFEQT